MSETAAVRRGGSDGWRTAVWVAGSAVCATALAQLSFMAAIIFAELLGAALGLTERVGVPVFTAIIALALVAYGAVIHLIVRAVGRSTGVPWVIWPAMAALPTAWVFVILANGSGALEPILAVLQLVGLAIAFVTLGERRWTKGWSA